MKQAAKFVWAIALILVACSQSPSPSTPESPDDAVSEVTMSTGEDDAAKRIFVDAEGGSYVLGSAGNSVFLNHYRVDGSLVWRADMGLKTCEACHTLDIRLVEDTLYTLTLEQATLTLSTFTLAGEKVSSQPLSVMGESVLNAILSSTGQSYILSVMNGEDGPSWYLEVLSLQGDKQWSKSLDFAIVSTSHSESSVSMALAPDDSVYLAGINTLQKYGAEGVLLWTQEFSFSEQIHIRENLAVGGDGSAYFFRDLTYGGDFVAFNVEVRRFSPEGEALWTRNLFGETVASRFHYPQVALFATSSSGTVFMTRMEHYSPEGLPTTAFSALYKIMPDGKISPGENMGDSRIYDIAFAQFEQAEAPSLGMDAKVGHLFTIGSSVRTQGGCYDPEDESTGSPYCPDTDAFVTEYRHFSSNQDISIQSEVVWTRY